MAERAVLACIHGPAGSWPLEDDCAELGELARSAGAEVVGAVLQPRGAYDPATLLSRGKVEELRAVTAQAGAQVVLCNRDLSPTQQMHLEEAVQVRVVDRTRLILDIFARRARSREGRIQVELAQCLYMLPRLAGLRGELSRLGGGIGTRGPGETQLETDRRRMRARIQALRADLARVARTREVQRRRRRQGPAVVALVGYTNAGKSTLHRALTASDVHVEDALFATLDPTTRAMRLPDRRLVLVTDTVGFVHDLPPDLVAAFRATLEEAADADLLLEVVDRHDPRCGQQRVAVERVLAQIGAGDVPRLLVWNKVDLDGGDAARGWAAPARDGLPPGGDDVPAVHVSALRGIGLERLREMMAALLRDGRVAVDVWVGFEAAGLVAEARREGMVRGVEYAPGGIHLQARCTPALAARLREAARAAAGRGPAEVATPPADTTRRSPGREAVAPTLTNDVP